MGLVYPGACGSSGVEDPEAALTLPGMGPRLAVK